jgi:hypothetical protein
VFWLLGVGCHGSPLMPSPPAAGTMRHHNLDGSGAPGEAPDLTAVWISCGGKSVVVNRDTIGDHSYTMVHEELGHQHDIKT